MMNAELVRGHEQRIQILERTSAFREPIEMERRGLRLRLPSQTQEIGVRDGLV